MDSDFLVNLPANSSPIVDADEEIFLLYTTLNQAKTDLIGPDGYRGLGHIDSRKDILTIQFELQPSNSPTSNPPSSTQQLKPTKKAKQSRKKVSDDSATRVIEFEIAQDTTALRSRTGDTGSVVWRASIALAKAILQQNFFPEAPLFDRDGLTRCTCLELGSGTGLLGLALAPLVRKYTITDIEAMLPLIRKNVSLNVSDWHDNPIGNSKPNIIVEELDWVTLSSLPPGPNRVRYCPIPNPTFGGNSSFEFDSTDRGAWDLVLAVDCIYNPSLLPALVETMDAVCTPGRTWVLVVAELRQEDVLREFLDLWLKMADGRWRITRVDGLLDVHFVVWAGQKT